MTDQKHEIHPLATCCPALSPTESEDTKASVWAVGVLHAIAPFQGKILGGRNRGGSSLRDAYPYRIQSGRLRRRHEWSAETHETLRARRQCTADLPAACGHHKQVQQFVQLFEVGRRLVASTIAEGLDRWVAPLGLQPALQRNQPLACALVASACNREIPAWRSDL